jgi:hypothetical protein
MKRYVFAAALAAASAICARALAADVGVSVSVGEPGFYGQINIGDTRPALIYPQPVVIEQGPVYGGPVYLHVPPGHEKHWAKHCSEYGACGRPVYFVQDGWYNDVYVPAYGRGHGPGDSDGGPGEGRGRGRGHGKGHGHD